MDCFGVVREDITGEFTVTVEKENGRNMEAYVPKGFCDWTIYFPTTTISTRTLCWIEIKIEWEVRV